ncbi:CheR family methyltransferase [Hymenobacter caeli]|uniref:protein-glutamate O-methyltransferase n=1 Tax=Hymenobacter caeli TaxID=2735894 RepID=A0ABX2FM20_9BACT|nr:CheR family methyltransferase [Hymenobacter caeli]NRT18056.1 two-component system CheB/CheR fusion protein [Hymenobacter caeli]
MTPFAPFADGPPGAGPDPAAVAPVAAESVTPRPRAGSGPPDRFAVVALCGSAGSLEALEQFFAYLPIDGGPAFVVVTHQGPGAPGLLAQVLQGCTALPVAEAADGLRLRPNHVYVGPPGHDLSLLHGCLYLLPPSQPAGRHLPIDFFLQTLAKDAGERAVCIIFSGLGSDGSLGLKLVMENFGMVMAQAPDTAAFDAMPRAALATEFVDFVLPPAQLPAQLLDYVARPLAARAPREPLAGADARPAHALQKIFLLIRNRTGHDFSFYKRNTMFRRIERRMNAHQIKEFPHYVRYLQENSAEVDQLFHELLIGVTKFFRDAEAFASLLAQLRPLLLRKEPHATVRVWAPGCSTGEEAYSLAMTLLEGLDAVSATRRLKLQIFASDISAEGIEFARAGLYPANIAADVSPGRLARFFLKAEGGGYQIRKEVRDVVVFALHNLNRDAPFTKLDLLCCRNLLIYLSAELQKQLLPVFHYALLPGGLLFLGPSENLTGFHDLFQPLDAKWKISRRLETSASPTRLLNFPFALTRQAPAAPPAVPSPASLAHRVGGPLAALVQKTLLDGYTPPAVVVNAKGEIQYVNGRTGKYLEPAPGLSGLNLFEMAREELRLDLRGAVHRALDTHEPVVLDEAHVQTDAGRQLLRLTVRPLAAPDALAGLLLVVFEDLPTPRRVRRAKDYAAPAGPDRDAAVAALDKELQYTRYRLHTTVEEMESSLEELKSTNEELQSANEELQSTNEEAMTNKEELQSLNEELLTLNTQYLAKTEELSQAANDMKNLLDATEIAIIFLDNDMVVKRFTPPAGRIVSLLPSDVGRPLAHFASSLRYEHLLRDVRRVLERLVPVEVNIQTTQDGWYTMRILPYRSLDNYINGAVVTFTDITALKRLEAQLQDTAEFTKSLQETVLQPVVALDADLRVYLANEAFAAAFGAPAAALRGQPLAAIGGGAWNQPALLTQLAGLLDPAADPTAHFDDLVLTADFAGLGRRRAVLYGRRLLHQGQPTGRVLLGVQVLDEAG